MASVFLLSPAYCGGRRAKMLLNPASESALAVRLRSGGLTLGDAFTFMSGLYFRGKISYAKAFAPDADSRLVITPTRGLMQAEVPVTSALLHEFAEVDISANDQRYCRPLERDLATLSERHGAGVRVVLLGSVATGKYVDLLVRHLGERLHFPTSFVGRGDMSRGGLLLRHAASGEELEYGVLGPGTRRHGPRPPRLDPASRVSPAGTPPRRQAG